jgi:hypothetical protein
VHLHLRVCYACIKVAENDASVCKQKLKTMVLAVSNMERDLAREKQAHEDNAKREQALGLNLVNTTERLIHSNNIAWSFKLGALEKKLHLAKTQLKEGQKEMLKNKRTVARRDRRGKRIKKLEAMLESSYQHRDDMLDDIREQKELHKTTLKELQLKDCELQEAASRLGAVTPWVSKLGKKGQQYDVFIAEVFLQLSGLGLTGPQAVYSLAIFLGRTYPGLVAGVDYRIPGAWYFKHVSECLYPIGVQLGRNLIDQALTAYIGGDGPPRKGFDYFATVASLVIPAEYIDDGDDTNELVSL